MHRSHLKECMKKVFEFLDLDYPSDIDQHIKEHTGLLKNHKSIHIRNLGEGYNPNSEKNSFEWRKKLKENVIESIEASCESVMKTLGYSKYVNIADDSDVLEKELSEIWSLSELRFAQNLDQK